MNPSQEKNTAQTVFINSKDTPQALIDHPLVRSKSNMIYGLTGIINTTNTCYMNSAIQAFSHLYPLTNYFFLEKENIVKTLKENARNIFKDSNIFKIGFEPSPVTKELREKIQDPSYSASMLTKDEETFILNSTMTYQLIKLLENMWKRNCIVLPTSFRKKFFQKRETNFFLWL